MFISIFQRDGKIHAIFSTRVACISDFLSPRARAILINRGSLRMRFTLAPPLSFWIKAQAYISRTQKHKLGHTHAQLHLCNCGATHAHSTLAASHAKRGSHRLAVCVRNALNSTRRREPASGRAVATGRN